MRILLGILATICVYAQTPDAREIIRKSVDRDFYDFSKVKDYTYIEYEVDREFDAKGNLKKTETTTDEVLILGGRPYEKLIAKDDKPLDEKKAKKEQEEMDKELARREHMSAHDKAKVEKERAEERAYLREIPDAFDFKIVGEDTVSGKPAWVIEATPRPAYKVKDSKANLLLKIRGKVWIDQAEYRWVKVEAEALQGLGHSVSGCSRSKPWDVHLRADACQRRSVAPHAVVHSWRGAAGVCEENAGGSRNHLSR